MASVFSLLLILFSLASITFAEMVPEDGYIVTTVLDGNKFKINPHSILPQPGSSDLIVLDSRNSAFYTASLPTSQSTEAAIKWFSGNGSSGFQDGDLSSAMFGRPNSFAVDSKGNVYVADKSNLVIRKISNSGVTTIAGGSNGKPGRADGPAQQASFSDEFELAFIPERCALLICDHGNQLVRQINLKAEDCASRSQSVAGMPLGWALSLVVVSCLFGSIVGFVIRPCVIHHTGKLRPPSSQRDMEALPNQSGETSTDTLLRHQKRSC